MITTIILYLLFTTIYLFISPLLLLPNATLSSEFSAAILSANSYLSAFNDYLPVATLISILGAILVIELSISLFKIISWVIKKIPTIS